MADEQSRLHIAAQRFDDLKRHARSLMLGTIDERSRPLVSYAPFVQVEARFHVYLSRLSEHTPAMLANPSVSAMIVEDESAAAEIFARTRVTYRCAATVVDPSGPRYGPTLDLFGQRFGNVMEVLRALPDFVLFELEPLSGRFVTGFGQAYDLAGDRLDRLVHVGPDQLRRG